MPGNCASQQSVWKTLYLVRWDFNSASVRSKTLIHQGHTSSEKDIHKGSDRDKETREDTMIQGLWYLQAGAIIDVKIDNNDVDSFKYEPMVALLDLW